MNLSSAAYLFTKDVVEQAGADDALSNADLHVGLFSPYEAEKSIRISGVFDAGIYWTNEAKVGKANAKVFIFFVVIPDEETAENLVEAAEVAEKMADEWLAAMFENQGLGNCIDVTNLKMRNEWIRPATARLAVCLLELTVNPQD